MDYNTILIFLTFVAMALTLMCWNARGLVDSSKAELEHLLSTKFQHCNIICLQEIDLYHSKHNIYIPGFNVVSKSRSSGKGGGVAILIKNSLLFEEVSIESTLESLIIKLTIGTNQPIYIVNIYTTSITIANTELQNIVNKTGPNTIFCGDFNSHNVIWGSTRTCYNGKLLGQFIEDKDLVIMNNGGGTRLDPRTLRLSNLDLIFCTKTLAPKFNFEIYYESSIGSDHYPLLLTSNLVLKNIQTINLDTWNFKKADWDKFGLLCDTHLNSEVISGTIDNINLKIVNTINECAKSAIPTKKTKCNKNPVPYWNQECTDAIKNRNISQNKARHSYSIDHYHDYVRNQKIVKETITRTKQEYWESYCNTLNDRSKLSNVWKTVKCLGNTAGSGQSIPNLTDKTDNSIKITTLDKANLLAKTYAKVSSNDNYSNTFKTNRSDFETTHCNVINEPGNSSNSGYNSDFTLSELKESLLQTEDKSPGEDKICYKMFKYMTTQSLMTILQFFNLIWSTNTFPKEWQHAIVVPILKAGKLPSDPSSYRPISLTSNICKLMEKMINNRLKWILETCNLYNTNQCGFRKQRSTIDQTIHLENEIAKAKCHGEYLLAVFIDLEKAFDMLWKEGLLYKLKQFGINGRMFMWIKNFLTDRSISVRVNGVLSDKTAVENGAPQGSCISPTLFNIMINDLGKNLLTKTSLSQFADDGAIWQTQKNIKFLFADITKELSKLLNYFNTWGFKVSGSKTVAVLFNRLQYKNIKHTIMMGTSKIALKPSAKFLGITYDSSCRWKLHIDNIIDKCNKRLNLIRMLTGTKWGADRHTLLLLYRTLILSVINYGAELYHSASAHQLKRLDTVQYKCLKLCLLASPHTSLAALQVESGELPLKLQRLKNIFNYKLKCSSFKPDHPATASLNDSLKFHTVPNNFSSFYINSKLPDRLNFDTATSLYSPIPPWSDQKLDIDERIYEKYICQNNVQEEVHKTISEHSKDSVLIYTDGSRAQDGKSSCSVVIPGKNITVGKRISNFLSVLSAELAAILFALSFLQTIKPHKAVIFTDSLFALRSLKKCSFQVTQPIVHNIKAMLMSMEKATHTKFVWIPAHQDIPGNVRADITAKQALSNSEIDVKIPLIKNEYNVEVEKHIIREWQNQWDNGTTGRHLFKLNKTVGTGIDKIYQKLELSKQKYKVLTRLRLGYCNLNYYLRMFDLTDTPNCQCGEPETIHHVLLECPDYNSERQHLKTALQKDPINLETILQLNTYTVPILIRYLEESGLIDRI